MTVRHSAFTFDAPAFIGRLRARCAPAGMFDAAALEAWAQEAARNASDDRLAILQTFRYDPEWGSPPPGEAPEPRLHLLTVLGEWLEPVAGLSRSHAHGYLVLQTALEALGWPAQAVKSLVQGNPLDTLFASTGIAGLDQQVTAFPWYVGWTAHDRIGGQRDELDKAAASIRAVPADLLARIAQAIHSSDGSAQQMLTDCLGDACDMLDAARAGGKDLLLVLD